MSLLRVLLVIIFLAITGYTALTVSRHGIDLLSVFLRDIASFGWPGQFDLDFWCYLLLSGLWVSYRHRFSPIGILLGVCALFCGSLFLSVYLLIESFRAKGNIERLLLGDNAM